MRAVRAGVYDGDTQGATRRRLRDGANLLLSNPDMLHQGILPYHARWGRFLRGLRFVVVDEIHAYRGIFGSHVANVLRRLERAARHVGGDFRVVMCSATIRNPRELAEALTGRGMTVVDDDGSPRGGRAFAFWNPPYADATRVERRSSNVEGAELLAGLVERGAQALAFTKSRVAAELVYRYARERLERARPGLGEAVRSYRGGYLPEERRRIEQALFAGELRGVVSTNALELGVDIGGLDAVVSIGAPPTLASLWQQAGRAGRRAGRDGAVYVAAVDDLGPERRTTRGNGGVQHDLGKLVCKALLGRAEAHSRAGHLAGARHDYLLLLDSTTVYRGVRADAALVSRSSGLMVRTSTTSTLTPSGSRILAASSAAELARWCDNVDTVAGDMGFMNILVGPCLPGL